MAMTLKQLEEQLNMETYTPMTEEEMRAQAENKYKTQYDQQRQAAQQAYDTSSLALDQQRAGLETSYAKQAEQAAQNTRQTYSAADRQSTSRGMQRSSFNNATLANINLAGVKTQNEIQQALTSAQGNIDQQKTLLTQQLAQTLAGYDTGYANDVAAYIDALRQQEYERNQAAEQYRNELLMALYEYGRGSGSGRSSGSSSGGSKTPAAAATGGNAYDSLYNSLNLGGNAMAGAMGGSITSGGKSSSSSNSSANKKTTTGSGMSTSTANINKAKRTTK